MTLVTTLEEAYAEADRIGYPVKVLKHPPAYWGNFVVSREEDLPNAFRRTIIASSGGVTIEPHAPAPGP